MPAQSKPTALQQGTKRKGLKEKSSLKTHTGATLRKPVPKQVTAIKSKTRSNSEPSITLMADQRKTEYVGTARDVQSQKNISLGQKDTGLGQTKAGKVKVVSDGGLGQPEREFLEADDKALLETPREMDGSPATRKRMDEGRERKSQMEADLQQHRCIVESCQKELTTLTHQLTDTVSDIEELELKMESLRRALNVSLLQLLLVCPFAPLVALSVLKAI